MDSNHLSPLRKGVVGVQFLFVAFGATVLVPLLVGLDPSTALFTAGIGTLLFHLVTRGKFLSSWAAALRLLLPLLKQPNYTDSPARFLEWWGLHWYTLS